MTLRCPRAPTGYFAQGQSIGDNRGTEGPELGEWVPSATGSSGELRGEICEGRRGPSPVWGVCDMPDIFYM